MIDFGGAGIARNDPDFFAAYIVNDILGGGTFSSRLYHEVRLKRGLVYSVYDSLLWYNDTAVFFGSTATRADRADETVGLIKRGNPAGSPKTARPLTNLPRPRPI